MLEAQIIKAKIAVGKEEEALKGIFRAVEIWKAAHDQTKQELANVLKGLPKMLYEQAPALTIDVLDSGLKTEDLSKHLEQARVVYRDQVRGDARLTEYTLDILHDGVSDSGPDGYYSGLIDQLKKL